VGVFRSILKQTYQTNNEVSDEFPMNSLQESRLWAKQALRAVDGNENGKQGK
jgi:hypothetical protein